MTISLIPTFDLNLFIPYLNEFLNDNPGVDVNVNYTNHRSNPWDTAELSIHFGTGH